MLEYASSHILGEKKPLLFVCIHPSLSLAPFLPPRIPPSSWAQPDKTLSLAFVKQPYLLDVALDELRGGHLLGRQTLFQL